MTANHKKKSSKIKGLLSYTAFASQKSLEQLPDKQIELQQLERFDVLVKRIFLDAKLTLSSLR